MSISRIAQHWVVRMFSAVLFFACSCCSMRAATNFQPQTRVGFTVGDQWEPAIAADASGHTYILYPQYVTLPSSCPGLTLPTMVLVVSNDNGSTWAPQRCIASPGTGPQYDAQIRVDPMDGRTVYASWLQNSKSQIVVAKSGDYGATWTTKIANSTNAGTDKDILVVKGKDVCVGYNHAQTVLVSSSHDGGKNFTSAKVNQNSQFGWSLAGGAAIDTAGMVSPGQQKATSLRQRKVSNILFRR